MHVGGAVCKLARKKGNFSKIEENYLERMHVDVWMFSKKCMLSNCLSFV
jgi:hypothetical protein